MNIKELLLFHNGEIAGWSGSLENDGHVVLPDGTVVHHEHKKRPGTPWAIGDRLTFSDPDGNMYSIGTIKNILVAGFQIHDNAKRGVNGVFYHFQPEA